MSTVLTIVVTSDGLSFTAATMEHFGDEPLVYRDTTIFDAVIGLGNTVMKVAQGEENPAAVLAKAVREVRDLPNGMRAHEYREAVEKALGL